MFRIYGLSLILVVLIMCSGCASIFSKSNYPVAVSSEPNEAMFQVVDGDGRIIFNGKTPTVIATQN
ncbi:hypothetical protein F4X10_02220 [Candidatus Poribacteria bacterium]|nr:hypothetical protein [Candidatus Poribacteria bacterium]